MYLHLGQNVVVPGALVVGIFDLDNTTGSKITKEFLSMAEKAGRIVSVSDELPNSFIVCDEGAPRGAGQPDITIYLSQLSSQTLLKRFETMRFE